MITGTKAISKLDLTDFKCQLTELQRYCDNLMTITDGLEFRYNHEQGGCLISREMAMAIMYGAEALEEYAHKTEKYYLDMIKED